jgi:hypothetical protein
MQRQHPLTYHLSSGNLIWWLAHQDRQWGLRQWSLIDDDGTLHCLMQILWGTSATAEDDGSGIEGNG